MNLIYFLVELRSRSCGSITCFIHRVCMYACVRVLIEVNVAPEGCAANLRPNRSNSIRTSPRKWMKHGD